MTVGKGPEWLGSLLAAIDGKDTETFLEYLSDDALFRFGSAPAVRGSETIRAAVDGFFDTIKGSTHSLTNTLVNGSTLVCEGEVTYQRLNDSKLTLPFVNVFELDGELISDYKIYIDIAPLYTE
jgi:ketosteroid isomerase-like protein